VCPAFYEDRITKVALHGQADLRRFYASTTIKDFLDSHKIKYVTTSHSLAYTAQEIAASAHIAGKELAKTVIIKIDDKMAMAVLPASYKVSFETLSSLEFSVEGD